MEQRGSAVRLVREAALRAVSRGGAAAREIGAQLTRAFDAVGATIRDDEAKADLKQAVSAVGEALGATFDEAALALRGVIGSKEGTPPPPPPGDDPPGTTPPAG